MTNHDFRYYFQHPYFRLFIAFSVPLMNFLMYAEDPVAHAFNNCDIPIVGTVFNFTFTRWTNDVWGLIHGFFLALGILEGCTFGKSWVHGIFLSMFYFGHLLTSTHHHCRIIFIAIMIIIIVAFLVSVTARV